MMALDINEDDPYNEELVEALINTVEELEGEIDKLKEQVEIARMVERLACAKVAAESSFGFPIEVWMKATKKEMTTLVALSIAKAILERNDECTAAPQFPELAASIAAGTA